MKDYAIKLNDTELIYFYYANNKIFSSIHYNGVWSKTKLITDNVMETFSLCLTPNNKFNIFYQDIDGNVILLTNENDSWDKKTILYNNDSQEKMLLHFSGMYIDDTFYIFFIQKNDNSKRTLVCQKLLENQKWSNSEVISTNIWGMDKPYYNYSANNNNLIMYSTLNETLSYGYSSFTNNNFSDFIPLFKTKQNIIDKSIVIINDTIHMVYCIKGLFSYQLIYKTVHDNMELNHKIVYEGQKVNNIMIFSSNNKIYISYTFNDTIYYTYSKDNGNKFEKFIKNKKTYSNIKKANYIKGHNNDYLSSEIYCNNKNKVILIDELYNKFYVPKQNNINEINDKENANENKNENENYDSYINELKGEILKYNKIINENNKKYENYIDKVNNHIKILEEKNSALLKELNTLHLQLQKTNN